MLLTAGGLEGDAAAAAPDARRTLSVNMEDLRGATARLFAGSEPAEPVHGPACVRVVCC